MRNEPERPVDAYYPPEQLRTASAGRRLAGTLLDLTIGSITVSLGLAAIAIAIPLAFFAFSWLAWFAVVAPRGQTPGKQLLGMHLVLDDGVRASAARTWAREILLKNLVFANLLLIPGGLFLLFDRRRQAWWDKLAGTHVAYSPSGFLPPRSAPSSR